MLTNLKTIISSLRRDEKGATAIEYGLIAAFIAVVIIGGAGTLGGRLDALFTRIAGLLG